MRWLLAVGLMLASCPAAADDDAGDTDPDLEDIVSAELIPKRIRLALAGTTAKLEARFVVKTIGPATEQTNQQPFTLPGNAVITGATVRQGTHVQRLRLERRATVDDLFAALVSRNGTGADRTWGLRLDGDATQGTVGLTAPHNDSLTLDVTLEAPTCFFADARHVMVPAAWVPRLPSPPVAADDTELIAACGEPNDDAWVALATRELTGRTGDQRIGVIASRLPLPGKHFARVELSLASALTDIPKDLHTVIVVDHSRSLLPTELENQRAIVEAYLRAVPNTRVQVIAYARTAQPLLPSWSAAGPVIGRVDRAVRSLPPRNGSNLDAGLAAAGEWLARVQGTRRVIVMTDERLAARFDDAVALKQLLPADTVVHPVTVFASDGMVTRADDAQLAPLAAATGGMAADAGVNDAGEIDVLRLVRPTSLDKISIHGAGWRPVLTDARACPLEDAFTPLAEQRSCVWWAEGTATSRPITVEGWLWGKRVTRVVAPDPALARSLARILSVEPSHTLDTKVREQVELAAHAVNSVWSLFAMWGKRGGYADLEQWGSINLHSIGTSSHSSGGHSIGFGHGTRTPSEELRRQLEGIVARCTPRTRVKLAIELTFNEIVSVEPHMDHADAEVETCIREGVWETSLAISHAPAYLSTTLDFQPV